MVYYHFYRFFAKSRGGAPAVRGYSPAPLAIPDITKYNIVIRERCDDMIRKVILWAAAAVSVLLCCFSFAEDGTVSANDLYGLNASSEINIPVFSEDAFSASSFEIPDNEAMRFIRELKAGWNLGNAFDAYDNTGHSTGLALETYWCHAKTTRELIHAIHEAGFNLIRIPVSWHNHVTGDDFTIDPEWMARVKEVAGWVVDEGMYFIINIHHDNERDFLFPDSAHYEQSERYVSSVWTQISEAFIEFDDHCIFESMNEPRLIGSSFEWWLNPNAAECKEAADCINRLNQKFVDTVRAAGGNNADRYLSVPGYCGSPDSVTSVLFKIPQDSAENRIILEVHAYRPYNFALNTNSTDRNFDPEKDSQKKNEIESFMNSLHRKYIKQGIPVLIDEFASLDKNNLQDRVNYTAYYIAAASSRGITCCLWDNHACTGTGEKLGIIDRNNVKWIYPEIALAMVNNSLFCREK